MSSTKYWPTYSLLAVLVLMAGVFVYISYEHNQRLEAIALGQAEKKNASQTEFENSIGNKEDSTATLATTTEDWREIYPKTRTIVIDETVVEASVANTLAELITGLSDTPYLPDEVVKLFVFDSLALHAIWMKDMNYPIDIIWVDEDYIIVDIKENALPESYPESFAPKKLAKYVIETNAGFVAKNNIKIGAEVYNQD